MPSGPSIHVSPAKDAEITRLLAAMSAAISNAAVNYTTMRKHYDDIQSRWWKLALDIHRSQQHTGARAHILDWAAFLREIYNPDTLGQLLRVVFEKEWAAAKKKHAGKLANAQKAMDLSETIELTLEIGPEACNNNQVVAGISSLRKPTNHQPVSPATIRQGLLRTLVNRVDDEDSDDGNPILSRVELSDTIKGTL